MELCVLQIDDDFINNIANERLIRNLGFPVTVKSFLDPEEALQHLATNEVNYDVILLDINMPRLTGWEFLDKYESFGNHFPVMMLTSSLDPNDQKRARASNLLQGYYVKPLSREIMLEILEKVNYKPN